jgi:hypothetical protein
MSTLPGAQQVVAERLHPRRRAPTVAVIVVLAAVGLLALPATSFAQATVDEVSITSPVGPDPVDDTCVGPGVVGILTGTETLTGRTVETETGFHFAGSLTLAYRVDFPDGSYVISSQIERLTFSGNDGRATFGGTLLDKGTLYDANGMVIGDGMFNARFRTTIVDGTAVVEIDDGHLTCR